MTELWPKDIMGDFKIGKKLGSGAYSTVHEAIHIPSGAKVAIKREQDLFADLIDCKRVLREIRLLRSLVNENVVKLLDVRGEIGLKSGVVYLILEIADKDLKTVIKSASTFFQPLHVKTMLYDTLKGIKYIHSACVLHRDIKPGNLLIINGTKVVICDFGLARSIAKSSEPYAYVKKTKTGIHKYGEVAEMMVAKSGEGVSPMMEDEKDSITELPVITRELTGYVVTRWYRAPEIVLARSDYGPGIDIWAVACIFGELLAKMKGPEQPFTDRVVLFPGTACYPFSPQKGVKAKGGISTSPTDQINVILSVIGTPSEGDCSFITNFDTLKTLKEMPKIERKNFSETYPFAGKEAIDLLDKMLQFNPYKRLTVDQCLEHPFLADIRKKESEEVAKGPILLDFEEEGELSKARLIELFNEDLWYFNALRMAGKISYK